MRTCEQFQNTVLEGENKGKGFWVYLWNGYRWQIFSGPFRARDDAEWSTAQWRQRFMMTNDEPFKYEFHCDE